MTLMRSRLSRSIVCAAVAIASAAHLSSATPCELSLEGRLIALRGHILLGDQYKFRDFLERIRARQISGVSLDSPGGSITAAGEIGRIIRAEGLTTIVDASRTICASSCTILFTSGIKRVYLHAPGAGGLLRQAGLRGLGFHQGSLPGQYSGSHYSGPGTAQMMGWYEEFGVPAAATLVDKAPPEAIYGLTGPLALSLGIATHTAWP